MNQKNHNQTDIAKRLILLPEYERIEAIKEAVQTLGVDGLEEILYFSRSLIDEKLLTGAAGVDRNIGLERISTLLVTSNENFYAQAKIRKQNIPSVHLGAVFFLPGDIYLIENIETGEQKRLKLNKIYCPQDLDIVNKERRAFMEVEYLSEAKDSIGRNLEIYPFPDCFRNGGFFENWNITVLSSNPEFHRGRLDVPIDLPEIATYNTPSPSRQRFWNEFWTLVDITRPDVFVRALKTQYLLVSQRRDVVKEIFSVHRKTAAITLHISPAQYFSTFQRILWEKTNTNNDISKAVAGRFLVRLEVASQEDSQEFLKQFFSL